MRTTFDQSKYLDDQYDPILAPYFNVYTYFLILISIAQLILGLMFADVIPIALSAVGFLFIALYWAFTYKFNKNIKEYSAFVKHHEAWKESLSHLSVEKATLNVFLTEFSRHQKDKKKKKKYI